MHENKDNNILRAEQYFYKEQPVFGRNIKHSKSITVTSFKMTNESSTGGHYIYYFVSSQCIQYADLQAINETFVFSIPKSVF